MDSGPDPRRFENPSAGRFAQPGEPERFSAPVARKGIPWYALALGAAFVGGRFLLHSASRAKGWAGLAFGLAGIGLGVFEYIYSRRTRDARATDGGDPYSPPNQISR